MTSIKHYCINNYVRPRWIEAVMTADGAGIAVKGGDAELTLVQSASQTKSA